MSVDIVLEVQKKREFSKLPRSVVKRVVDSINEEDVKEKVKQARIILRKYFGVFLTNRVIKPKDITDYDSVLKSHKSSHKRDYTPFYEKIHEVIGEKVGSVVGSIIDLGCGMNGFSYPYIQNVFGNVGYTGIEASGQIVDSTNTFFETSSFAGCTCIWGDVFNTTLVTQTLKRSSKKRLVFLFQVVDALENVKADFSKEFLLQLKKNSEYIVVSLPQKSLSGRKTFEVKRNWIVSFLEEHFEILDDFSMFDERFICVKC